MRNIIIWDNCCVHAKNPASLRLCLSLRLSLAHSKVLSSRRPGFHFYFCPTPPPPHCPWSPHPLLFPPPVTQLWPCAACENSHQIILTKHQHLLERGTPLITHTCTHTCKCSFTYKRSTLIRVFGAYTHTHTLTFLWRPRGTSAQKLNKTEVKKTFSTFDHKFKLFLKNCAAETTISNQSIFPVTSNWKHIGYELNIWSMCAQLLSSMIMETCNLNIEWNWIKLK